MKTNFHIPQTTSVIVRWLRSGRFTDTLIPRPANNEVLRLTMLTKHQVGCSEIRCIKAVDGLSLSQAINRNFGRWGGLT